MDSGSIGRGNGVYLYEAPLKASAHLHSRDVGRLNQSPTTGEAPRSVHVPANRFQKQGRSLEYFAFYIYFRGSRAGREKKGKYISERPGNIYVRQGKPRGAFTRAFGYRFTASWKMNFKLPWRKAASLKSSR